MSVSETPTLSAADFQKISRLAYDQFGLNLPAGKETLVSARLGKQMRIQGFHTFAEYYAHVQGDATGQALTSLIDALTTNFTSFLREPRHFEFLTSAVTGEFRDVTLLRVWSAACSSGEEPYTIAMSLLDTASRVKCAWAPAPRILATDISTRVLDVARCGIYAAQKFDEVPDTWKRAFLLKGSGEAAGKFKIKPHVAALVEFGRLNLMEQMPPSSFHFIFCRNVMIYFDRPTQQNIVRRLAESLLAGGYLFIGHSESLNGFEHPLRYFGPAIYRKEARS
jgi:chemotaxis protein methyltransferase CheR